MNSPRLKEATQVCFNSCCPVPSFNMTEEHKKTDSKPARTSAVCRRDFVQNTAASLFPDTNFTNHESLPSQKESFLEFKRAYPQYYETQQVDDIRAQEYSHLSRSKHACLDYIGIGLFSYAQLQRHKFQLASSSSPLPPNPSPSRSLNFPFFGISYKTGNLKVQLLHGGQESVLESAMKKRIMSFLHISENDYSMVFTANRTSAFKLVANSYPYKTSRKLLTVYDYESEAVEAMIHSSEKRGAHAMSAEFSWPRLRINSSKLRNMMVSKRENKMKNKRGIFVFPLHSRVTGARYPYLWMSIARENGWHVLIDACALGPKDMDSFGFSLLRPDFLVCSFYKVFGENPSGFGCLFVKKSVVPILEDSTSTGIVNIVPAKELLQLAEDSSGTDLELEQTAKFGLEDSGLTSPSSFSGPLSNQTSQSQSQKVEQGESSGVRNVEITGIVEGPKGSETGTSEIHVEHERSSENGDQELECKCLDQVDSLGLILITNRSRYLINWLVNSLLKLEHPNAEGVRLVRIYGPKIKFDRGPALAFNIFDWKGEKVEPVLVQKLADRSSISLSYGFLHHIYFADKYAEMKERFLEKRERGSNKTAASNLKGKCDQGITVVTAALGFLANFEDTYRLWAFVAQFLDADFVEKERWRYTSLNQNTIEV